MSNGCRSVLVLNGSDSWTTALPPTICSSFALCVVDVSCTFSRSACRVLDNLTKNARLHTKSEIDLPIHVPVSNQSDAVIDKLIRIKASETLKEEFPGAPGKIEGESTFQSIVLSWRWMAENKTAILNELKSASAPLSWKMLATIEEERLCSKLIPIVEVLDELKSPELKNKTIRTLKRFETLVESINLDQFEEKEKTFISPVLAKLKSAQQQSLALRQEMEINWLEFLDPRFGYSGELTYLLEREFKEAKEPRSLVDGVELEKFDEFQEEKHYRENQSLSGIVSNTDFSVLNTIQ